MVKMVISGAVLAVAALLVGLWSWRLARSPKSGWGRNEVRFALVGAILVVPAVVVHGIVDGKAAGIGGFILWGLLAVIAYGTTRYDNREYEELELETRWLLDVDVLVFVLVTGFFGVLDFAMVYVPAAAALVVSARYAHLRHGGPLFRRPRLEDAAVEQDGPGAGTAPG